MQAAAGSAQVCPLCLAPESRLVGERGRDGEPLRSLRCSQCGLVRVDPIPAARELREFYQCQYRQSYKGVRQPKPKHVYRAGRLAIARLRLLRAEVVPGASVLDIGSGAGEFLYVLRASGYDASGIELDPGYAAAASEQLGVSVEIGSLWDAGPPENACDAITMFHVLEHLPDPVDALRRCGRSLKTGGILLLEVPNVVSPHQHPAKRFHRAHLLGFTAETLRYAAELGFQTVRIAADRYERNITGVFRKVPAAPSPRRPGERLSIPAPDFHRESLLAYYTRPSTYRRFLERAAQYLRERLATFGESSSPRILDALLKNAAPPR